MSTLWTASGRMCLQLSDLVMWCCMAFAIYKFSASEPKLYSVTPHNPGNSASCQVATPRPANIREACITEQKLIATSIASKRNALQAALDRNEDREVWCCSVPVNGMITILHMALSSGFWGYWFSVDWKFKFGINHLVHPT